MGCWMGKNIGGTLGAPMEWRRQINNVTFYTQELGGEPLPNDDLDIQLAWLVALEERGIDLTAHDLAEYWLLYVTPHWCEYGTAKANLRAGLLPPLSGTYGNDYKDSCGAFIRSEIWACITPGNPQAAARYAYEDAILDHGNGEGTYAEVFFAAMESAAFVESDIHTLIEIGLSYIPESCGVAGAVRFAIECYRAGIPWQEARDKMLESYRGSAFFGQDWAISAEDKEKGFFSGGRGWDVPSNIGMLLIGLLYGGGDFAETLCTTVNCGEDTDCTAATVGSIFGIIHGIDGIPENWIAPIGRGIKTMCLNKGELYGNLIASTVDELTDRTIRIAKEWQLRRCPGLKIADEATDLVGLNAGSLMAGGMTEELYFNLNGPVYRFPEFTIGVDYGEEGPIVRDDTARTVRLNIRNTYKTQAQLLVKWYPADGWKVTPPTGTLLSLPKDIGKPVSAEFVVEAEVVRDPLTRMVVELTIPGRTTCMLVPITLLNGNLSD
jgi:ADP-ribosylglycohydrolase